MLNLLPVHRAADAVLQRVVNIKFQQVIAILGRYFPEEANISRPADCSLHPGLLIVCYNSTLGRIQIIIKHRCLVKPVCIAA